MFSTVVSYVCSKQNYGVIILPATRQKANFIIVWSLLSTRSQNIFNYLREVCNLRIYSRKTRHSLRSKYVCSRGKNNVPMWSGYYYYYYYRQVSRAGHSIIMRDLWQKKIIKFLQSSYTAIYTVDATYNTHFGTNTK